MTGLELRLFGPPRVLRGGVEIRFDTRKAVALLALLAVKAREQSRESLADTLWPELDRQHSRAALRRTLSVAAAMIPELTVDGQAVCLELEEVQCDVLEFRRLVDSDVPRDWAAAAELVRGPFLDGFALRDSALFDHWQSATSDALRDDASLVLALLVDERARSGDLPAALHLARRRVEIDRLSEPAHVDLIRITAWTGDRVGALRAYRDLATLLDRELGVVPLAATIALEQTIRSDALGAPESGAVRSVSERSPAAVDDMTRQVVEAVFAIGVADRDLIRAVAGRTEVETAAAIDDALALGLLRVVAGSNRIETSDAVVIEMHRSLPPLPRLRLLHARAADALARRHAAGPEAQTSDDIGRHFAAAGRDDLAADWFATAAKEAAGRGDHADALAAWRSVVAVGRNSVDVQVAIGSTLARLGRTVEALVALGQAADLAAGDDRALDAAREGLALAERQDDPHLVVAMRSHLADLLHAAGRDGEALDEQRRWAAAFAELYGADASEVWGLADF